MELGQTLQGKVAVVTGAARGIGKAVAVALAKEGVNVGIIARSEDALQQVAKEIESHGVKAAYAVADVSNLEQVQKAAAHLKEELGLTDILVNNAGVGKFDKLVDMDPAEFKEIVDINVMGTFYVSHTIVPQLIEKNAGDVINISSTNGLNGAATSSAYSASKFGVIGLTESLAAEVRRNNIRVTALAPSTNARAGVHRARRADPVELEPDPVDVLRVAVRVRGGDPAATERRAGHLGAPAPVHPDDPVHRHDRGDRRVRRAGAAPCRGRQGLRGRRGDLGGERAERHSVPNNRSPKSPRPGTM